MFFTYHDGEEEVVVNLTNVAWVEFTTKTNGFFAKIHFAGNTKTMAPRDDDARRLQKALARARVRSRK